MCGAINHPRAFITCMGTTFPLPLHGKLTHCLSSDVSTLSKKFFIQLSDWFQKTMFCFKSCVGKFCKNFMFSFKIFSSG